ncbi:MAG: hypothetical protein HRU25_03040 [Psychrobium sp.]|nr:hypothetical protein [Psychrobium sp.]
MADDNLNLSLPLIVLLDDELYIVKALARVLRPVAATIVTFTCPFAASHYF